MEGQWKVNEGPVEGPWIVREVALITQKACKRPFRSCTTTWRTSGSIVERIAAPIGPEINHERAEESRGEQRRSGEIRGESGSPRRSAQVQCAGR